MNILANIFRYFLLPLLNLGMCYGQSVDYGVDPVQINNAIRFVRFASTKLLDSGHNNYCIVGRVSEWYDINSKANRISVDLIVGDPGGTGYVKMHEFVGGNDSGALSDREIEILYGSGKSKIVSKQIFNYVINRLGSIPILPPKRLDKARAMGGSKPSCWVILNEGSYVIRSSSGFDFWGADLEFDILRKLKKIQ